MPNDNYLGELRVFAFPYETEGWRMCNGQLLSIKEFEFIIISFKFILKPIFKSLS